MVGEVAPCSNHLGGVIAVAAGTEESLALLEDGTVEAWGFNGAGQLGDGRAGISEGSSVPVPVCAVGEAAPCMHQLSEVTAIAAGNGQSLALLKNGTVVSWGVNILGDLGDGTTANSDVPVPVCAVGEKAPCAHALSKVTAISAGGESHSLALLENGTVVSWGGNDGGKLGNGTTENSSVPVSVCAVGEKAPCIEDLSKVMAISAGHNYSLALLEGGQVRAWGENSFGQLGDGTNTGPSKCGSVACSTTPTSVSELGEVKAISAGDYHGLALLKGGTVMAWGYNGYGQLGDNSTKASDVPIAVEDLSEVVGISAGEQDSFSYGPPMPTVNSLSPSSGPTTGGTAVMIAGVNFTGATKVKFGAMEASSFTVESPTLIKVTTPAEKPGRVAVRVITPAGTSPPGEGIRFRYLPTGTEYGRCKKVTTGTGKYSSATCTAKTTGNYEWTPGFVKGGFTGKSVTETTVMIETAAEKKMVCLAETATGSYTETKQVAGMVVKLTGCEYPSTGAKCSSAGAAEGEVVTNTLEGTLGWINEEKNKVGLDLFPTGEEEPVFEASCGATSIKVRGSVIARVTNLNNMESTFKLLYKQKKGKQEDLQFEGEAGEETLEASINGGTFEKAGLGLESKLTNEEELEINTVV